MPKITIDGRQIECRDKIPVLQAALDAGWDVPHYCYHPGLSIVASCRLCLMEMQMPHPKTGEMDWSPKLAPSCQTLVKDGMVVRFNSEKVQLNQKATMEAYLLNHPLDCPVCDKAGECYLQDYSFRFGNPTSRMVDLKTVMPKKDLGPQTLIYSDRCVFCSRCVRFCDEVVGTHELCMVSRAGRSEIDVFPGLPLDNPLQGNVVDICPVGALLDKDFLFKERVWNLKSTPSLCPGCSTGCAIEVDSNSENEIKRLRPRWNPGVNDWWMCDEGRFGFNYVHDPRRLTAPIVRRGMDPHTPRWEELPGIIRVRLQATASEKGADKVVAVLSPMMSCEEAWLLIRFIREIAPLSALVLGHVPMAGDDQHFPAGASNGHPKFTIHREKCPNCRGIERLLDHAGGTTLRADEFIKKATAGEYDAAWISGGYSEEWVTKAWSSGLAKIPLIVGHDIFPSLVTEAASVVIPACTFAEREGCFMNQAGRIQTFQRAIDPPDGCRRDGQFFHDLAGFQGLYNAKRVREMMAREMPEFGRIVEPPEKPLHQH